MYDGTPSGRAEQWAAGAATSTRNDLDVGLRAPADGADGRELRRPGAAREFVPRLSGAGTGWSRRAVAEFIADVEARAAGVGARRSSAWIVWFWIGMEASMMLGIDEKAGPPARGARRGGDAAAAGRGRVREAGAGGGRE